MKTSNSAGYLGAVSLAVLTALAISTMGTYFDGNTSSATASTTAAAAPAFSEAAAVYQSLAVE